MGAVAIRSTPTPPPSVGLPEQPPATPSSTPALSIGAVGMGSAAPIAIPGKHLVSPNPGGIMKFTSPVTPPASPPDGLRSKKQHVMDSLLYPADRFKLYSRSPPIYKIDAAKLSAALFFQTRQSLPDIDQVFPWAHGLHPENMMQLSFFAARKKAARRTPTCFRGICIVKAGGDLSTARLKGAVAPDEVLPQDPLVQGFLDVDPAEGFNVRNFHIQVGKFACISDVVVYCDDKTDPAEMVKCAKRIAAAQLLYRQICRASGNLDFPKYNTFIVKSSFSEFEEQFPELVTVNGQGLLTGTVVDFCHWEKMEMCSMSKASEVASNVFIGTTQDARDLYVGKSLDVTPDRNSLTWDVVIECSDLAQMPPPETLRDVMETLEQNSSPQFLEFPGSVNNPPVQWTQVDTDGLIDTCRWIYAVANGKSMEDEAPRDADGDYKMKNADRAPKKVLIHCTDGYTETSLLGLAYIMYAERLPVYEAWVKMHTTKSRNFFAYFKDLNFLREHEGDLLSAGAHDRNEEFRLSSLPADPEWLDRMDGSLPSRVLNYMYLGNLQHANNPCLLAELGIKRVLSIGEELSWTKEQKGMFAKDRVMVVRDLQDNGCDALEKQFWGCLDFIDEGHRLDEPTLVHCRVGVSRSATICIAEVMRSLRLSLPRAYCYVRARRLNVIIQPHLRFMYELLTFEENLKLRGEHGPKRELEWMHVANEIATMNRPYTRQN